MDVVNREKCLLGLAAAFASPAVTSNYAFA
jgi:hypothetical protein